MCKNIYVQVLASLCVFMALEKKGHHPVDVFVFVGGIVVDKKGQITRPRYTVEQLIRVFIFVFYTLLSKLNIVIGYIQSFMDCITDIVWQFVFYDFFQF
jgi:hypothetical protein